MLTGVGTVPTVVVAAAPTTATRVVSAGVPAGPTVLRAPGTTVLDTRAATVVQGGYEWKTGQARVIGGGIAGLEGSLPVAAPALSQVVQSEVKIGCAFFHKKAEQAAPTFAAMSAAVGAPTAACVPPGNCIFTEEWSSATLLECVDVSHDVILATFGLADPSKPLGLSTCACILSKFNEEGSPDPIVRPYTPVSTNALLGKFQLAVKVYEGGKMSNHIKQMPIGGTLDFKHIPFNVKIQYPFDKKYLVMLVGGTGITPMIQALHAILGTPGDETKVMLIFGNKTQQDILCKDVLDQWSADFPDRLQVVHVLSEEPANSTWTGTRGYISRNIIEMCCPPPSQEMMIFVCGPPPMYAALCGPRDKKELRGVLSEMGYQAEHVFKF